MPFGGSALFSLTLILQASILFGYKDRSHALTEKKGGEGTTTLNNEKRGMPIEEIERIKKLVSETRNLTRNAVVQETLRKAAGVYKDKSKAKSMGIENTVIISVVAYPVGEHYYKVYFRNFLCFARHHGLDLVVYTVHDGDGDSYAEVLDLEKLGVHALTYPEERFWRLVSGKQSKPYIGAGHAKYSGSKVSFREFGALPMLVPSLEVLEAGFNVIYFDVDIALVLDPVPFLIRGDADFVASIESRSCREVYLGAVPTEVDWERIEPNTGIMHLRATKQGIRFVTRWLERVVEGNFVNDQRALSRRFDNATYTPNCLPSDSEGIKDVQMLPSIRKDPDAATYCLLSDVQFQNGMVGLQCQAKKMFRSNWLLSNYQYGVHIDDKRYPVTLHVNFCNGKSNELMMRNLWLLRDQDNAQQAAANDADPVDSWGCKAFRLNDTYYGKLNWTQEVFQIESDTRRILEGVLRNGTLIKKEHADETYMLYATNTSAGLIKRAFPDGDTFLNMGFDFESTPIHKVPAVVLGRIPDGEPFKSTLDWSKNTQYVQARKKYLEEVKNYEPFWTPNLKTAGKLT